MPPVRRKAKALLLVDQEDIGRFEIGMAPRVEFLEGARWRRIWAKRWPVEGAALMDAMPQCDFAWALATFGDPRRRRSVPRKAPGDGVTPTKGDSA